jgi:hypothetical protein
MGVVACNALTTLGGRGEQSPPAHRLGRACTLSSAHTISVTISKLIFKTYFVIIINGNFLRLMFKFSEIVTYSWPKRNGVDVYLTSRSKF